MLEAIIKAAGQSLGTAIGGAIIALVLALWSWFRGTQQLSLNLRTPRGWLSLLAFVLFVSLGTTAVGWTYIKYVATLEPIECKTEQDCLYRGPPILSEKSPATFDIKNSENAAFCAVTGTRTPEVSPGGGHKTEIDCRIFKTSEGKWKIQVGDGRRCDVTCYKF